MCRALPRCSADLARLAQRLILEGACRAGPHCCRRGSARGCERVRLSRRVSVVARLEETVRTRKSH